MRRSVAFCSILATICDLLTENRIVLFALNMKAWDFFIKHGLGQKQHAVVEWMPAGYRHEGERVAEHQKLPFHSFKFSLIEGQQPRTFFSLVAPEAAEGSPDESGNVEDDVFYHLSIVKGSAANPLSSIKRDVPLRVAMAFRDALQDLGVFDWDEEYGDAPASGMRKWSMTLVFQKEVFSISSKGGSAVPPHFDYFLEELYKLDFPRPIAPKPQGDTGVGSQIGDMMGAMGVNSIGSMSSGDLGAYSAIKGTAGDLSYLKGMFGAQGMPDELKNLDLENLSADDIQEQLKDLQQDPEAYQAQMKEAYKYMSVTEKEQLLDMMARMTGQSREWWRHFFEG